MEKYTLDKKDYDLEDKDFLMVKAMDNLTSEIKRLVGRLNG